MIPVHNHSEFSALDGFSTVEQIADRLVEADLKGAFLTDHGVVAGWRPFHKALAKRDLFAGFGMEAYQARESRHQRGKARDASHLILLAKNAVGIKNLMLMNYHAYESGSHYVARVDWELLEQYREGILCTSACVAGLVAKGVVDEDETALNRLLNLFGEDFFIELHTYTPDKDMKGIGQDKEVIVNQREMNEELIAIAKERGIPLVYANDAHYACRGDHPHHEVLLAAQMNKALNDPNRISHPKPCLYIMDEPAVREALDYLPDRIVDEAIANSDLIADICKDGQLPVSGKHLPVFIPKEPTEKSNNDLLIDLVKKGLKERYGEITPAITERALYELRTIIGAGLGDYFLITHDFCYFADSVGIGRGPGRGSVAGSIMAYALYITDIDPLKYGLYFERFYNVGREEGLPDIDIDFVNERRDEIDKYLKGRWGEHHVIPIGTHLRMKPLAALDRLGKVFKVPVNTVDEIKAIVKSVPDIGIISADQLAWHVKPGIKVAVLEEEIDGEIVPREQQTMLMPYILKHPKFFDAVVDVTGKLFSYGVHASAVVISDVDVREILPVRLTKDDTDDEVEDAKKRKLLVTQIEMKEVEALGFPKFDRLGLKTLDVLDEVRRMIGEDVRFWSDLDWDNQPDEMWEQIEKGNTLGFFQVEDGMAKSIGKRLRPRGILDLAAIVALNRPGPLRQKDKETGLNAVELYLRRRQGDMDIAYPHAILEDVLDETYGVFLYQEQILTFLGKIGYNPIEADNVRSILGKKKVAEMVLEKPKYMAAAIEHMDEQDAEDIWLLIEDFAFYSFNKAHAVSYAFILARTMYAKFNHRVELFMANIHKAKDREKKGQFVMEARRMGIKVFHPDVNVSKLQMANIDGNIYFGLQDVKNVVAAANWVIKHRPYQDYASFTQFHEVQQAKWEETKKGRSPRQQITSLAIENLRKCSAFGLRDDATLSQIADDEVELLGVALTSAIPDVLAEYPEDFEGLATYDNLGDMLYLGHPIRVPGQVFEVRTTRTKRGKTPGAEMGFVKIEWFDGATEFTVWPEKWAACKKWLFQNRNIGIFTLTPGLRGPIFESGKKYTPVGGLAERNTEGAR